MSRLYATSPATERRWTQITFGLSLCVVVLVPFWLFPSSRMDIWPADDWAGAGTTWPPTNSIEPPPDPPDSKKPIEEDEREVRKQFQQVHLSIHNNEESYIEAIEKGRRAGVGASAQIGVTWVDHLQASDAIIGAASLGEAPPPAQESSSSAAAAVKYGLASDNYSFQASASTHTYSHGGWRGLIHDALLRDLLPSERYYYRVGNPRTDEWSDEFSFAAPPLPPFLSFSSSSSSSSSSSIHTRGIDSSSSSVAALVSTSTSAVEPAEAPARDIRSVAGAADEDKAAQEDNNNHHHHHDEDKEQNNNNNKEEEEEEEEEDEEVLVLGSLAVFGDNGISHSAREVITRISEDSAIHAVVHVGDFAYSLQRGGKWTVEQDSYGADKQAAWDKWFRMVEPLAASRPYMAVPGNHETFKFDYHFVPYAHRFFMPGNGFWFWFDYASIHFVALSSDHNYSRGSDQYTWLEAHLTEFNRARNAWMRAPTRARKINPEADANSEAERERRTAWWLVALVHRSMYSSSVEQGSVLHLRHELEPLFVKHGVDLVVHGHDHNYERTHPVVKERVFKMERAPGFYVKSCTERVPPIYLRAGTGGIELNAIWDPQPAWSAVVNNEGYGYIRLTAYANDTLKSEFVSSRDALTYDTLLLVKDTHLLCDQSHAYTARLTSPWLLAAGAALAVAVACQARYCRRKRRRVFDMQHFFSSGGALINGGYYLTTNFSSSSSAWSSSSSSSSSTSSNYPYY